jgi:hypothetical protein
MIPGKGVSQEHQEVDNTMTIMKHRDDSIKNRANIYDSDKKLIDKVLFVTYTPFELNMTS